MTIVFDEETARVEMTIQDETEEMLVAAGTSLINVRRININDFEWCAQVSPKYGSDEEIPHAEKEEILESLYKKVCQQHESNQYHKIVFFKWLLSGCRQQELDKDDEFLG